MSCAYHACCSGVWRGLKCLCDSCRGNILQWIEGVPWSAVARGCRVQGCLPARSQRCLLACRYIGMECSAGLVNNGFKGASKGIAMEEHGLLL